MSILLIVLLGLATVLITFVLILIISAAAVDTQKKYTEISPFYRCLLDVSIAILLPFLRIRIHVTGEEKLSEKKAYLFVGNHRSNFDPILTWYIFRKYKIAYISKYENFSIPIYGKIIRRCGCLGIDRVDPRKAMETVNQAAELLRNGISVGVYPEGTRNKGTELLPFHNGVFKIAQKAQAPIAILTLCGTEKIVRNGLFRRPHVELTVSDVLSEEEVVTLRSREIGEEVRKAMEGSLHEKEKNGTTK